MAGLVARGGLGLLARRGGCCQPQERRNQRVPAARPVHRLGFAGRAPRCTPPSRIAVGERLVPPLAVMVAGRGQVRLSTEFSRDPLK